MLIARNELKDMKKDIKEQIKAGIEIQDLYIKNFITYGDNLFEGNTEVAKLDGRISSKELAKAGYEGFKVYKQYTLGFEIDEENEVDVFVKVEVVDEYDYMIETYITLNI